MRLARIVIAGAGLAGSRCARTLRTEGYDGSITLIGDEPYPPYERTALSREFLAGSPGEPLLVSKPHAVAALHRQLAAEPLAA